MIRVLGMIANFHLRRDRLGAQAAMLPNEVNDTPGASALQNPFLCF